MNEQEKTTMASKTTQKTDKHLRICACGQEFRTKRKAGRPFSKCSGCREPAKRRAA